MKFKLFAFVVLAASSSAGVNVFAQQPPSAGGQLLQLPPPPIVREAVPEIEVERNDPQPAPSPGEKFLVTSLRVTGATLFSEAELIAVTSFKPDSTLDLSELRAMASRIAEFYNVRGYFVAQAFLPAQTIEEGVVTIEVIEGRYDTVELRNQTNLSDGLANNVLDGLESGDIVAIAPLERRLLLLSDIPGIEVQSTLIPGASVGTSDLIVDITPGRRVTGSVEADNAGNRYTGAYRVGGTVNFNEPLGYGDVASLRVLSSTNGGLVYLRGSYQAQLHSFTLGAAYASLWYRLGKEFSSLEGSGTATIASVYGSYPLIRSRNSNLYAALAFDAKSFEDKTGVPSTVTEKNAEVLIASLYGDHGDKLGGGGWNYYSVSWAFGNLDIETPIMRAADRATARSNGNYNKLAFEVARLQNISGPVSLFARVRGQIASKNLDSSEKMELGGAYAVRAYPEGEAFGDQGYVATLEARLLLPDWSESLPGETHLFGFVDTGTVTVNETPWVSGSNRRTLSGAGLGLSWADNNNFLLKATYAHKLGNAEATSAPDAAGRFWFQVIKFF